MLERHGSIFCAHTWYSIPDYNKAPLIELIFGIDKEFKFKSKKANNYIFLQFLPVQVPLGHVRIVSKHADVVISTISKMYADPSRPNQNSIPFKTKKSKSKNQLSIELYKGNKKPQQMKLSRFFGSLKVITQSKLGDYYDI